ncbi:uncharacterized protein LOC143179521 [Calliopsis andreniformis]|uniref:uncharacterized protein LOC143179521 n=1 Tax=Calliopsis andreniformis TaxID=337506 RepID=UPI003FCC8A6F
MAEDLLVKEKGFHQLNKELEQKAQDLMKEVDLVINTYNSDCSVRNLKLQYSNLIKEKKESFENTITRKEENSQISVKRNVSLPHKINQDFSSKLKEVQKNPEDEVPKKGNLAHKAIVDLFKAKIDLLQNELQVLSDEYRKKCDNYKDLESEYKKMEVKSQNEIELLKDTIIRLENTNKELQCQCLTLNTENSVIKKDLDKLEKQIKVLTQQSNNYSTRLNRSLESNDKLRNGLKCSQIEEKELRNQIRKLQEEKRLSVNNLGKQISELIHVFKKQMLFIDNLKKQNACLMAIRQLNLTKEDFLRLLDLKT